MLDWPVTQPTGDEAMLLGEVTTAAVEIVAAAEAGAFARRPDVANPDTAATAGESPVGAGVRAAAASARVTTCAALGVATAAAAGALIERALPAVVLFEVRADEAAGLFALAEDPVLDELCVEDPEPPESEVSAHAAPAPARIATPTPRPTAKPPRRPTYAEALFVELITVSPWY
ncbi:hypothetical protein [Mycolicibacterium helvum]|uniref:hypothetical protein n=1 Tax=Mycolicibacterium helvum TaxID=1534349 RepID=UPI001FEA9B76|nr:hypothetical protein [Mycolicibacterium helvum]